MDTHKIRGEDHYKCREVKAERDMLRDELDALQSRLAAAEAALQKIANSLKHLREEAEADGCTLNAMVASLKARGADDE